MMAGFDGMELNPGPLCAVGLHYSFITCALGAGFQHCDRLFIKDPTSSGVQSGCHPGGKLVSHLKLPRLSLACLSPDVCHSRTLECRTLQGVLQRQDCSPLLG